MVVAREVLQKPDEKNPLPYSPTPPVGRPTVGGLRGVNDPGREGKEVDPGGGNGHGGIRR